MVRKVLVSALVLIAIVGLVSAQAPSQPPTTTASALTPSEFLVTAQSPGGEVGTIDDPATAPEPEGDHGVIEGPVGGPVSPDSWDTPPSDEARHEKSGASAVHVSLAVAAIAGFFC